MRVDEQGQALPLMLVVLAVGAAILLAGVRIAPLVDDAARARTAADAAALAGAVDGEPAAVQMAAANGGELIDFRRSGLSVEVEVRVGAARATAGATASIVWVPG